MATSEFELEVVILDEVVGSAPIMAHAALYCTAKGIRKIGSHDSLYVECIHVTAAGQVLLWGKNGFFCDAGEYYHICTWSTTYRFHHICTLGDPRRVLHTPAHHLCY